MLNKIRARFSAGIWTRRAGEAGVMGIGYRPNIVVIVGGYSRYRAHYTEGVHPFAPIVISHQQHVKPKSHGPFLGR